MSSKSLLKFHIYYTIIRQKKEKKWLINCIWGLNKFVMWHDAYLYKTDTYKEKNYDLLIFEI